MPLKSSTSKRNNTRPKAYAALLAALVALSAAALSGVGARAQRRNDNTQQQQGGSSRRVFVGRGSDTSNGSRVTIKSDDPLNDYSAYRSGDRFYVVLPKSAAGAVSKGSGKGYTDVQVQQRGDSVVVSYKVQPGAKPRVEQKFNRLDVVFDVKDGGQPAASGQESAAANQQPAVENRNPSASAQQQQQQQQATPTRQSATQETPNERRPAEAASNTTQPAATANPSNNAAQPAEAAQQQPVAEQTQPAPSPSVEQMAATAPTSEPQLAQNQPPAPIAPITNPNSSAAGAQAGTSFGTMLAQNWPIPLFIALFVIGLGLVIFTRRSSANAPAELEPAGVATATTTTATLEEPRAARLKEATAVPATVEAAAPDADAVASKTAPLAEVAPLVAAPFVAAGKKNKKKRKGKTRGGRAEELPLAKDEKAEEPSIAEEPSVAETPAEASVAETVTEAAAPSVEEAPAEVSPIAEAETPTVEASTAAETLAAPAEVSTTEAEAANVLAPAVALTSATEAATHAVEDSTQAVEESTHAVEASTPAVEEVSEGDASREVSIEPSVAAVEASAVEPFVETVASTPSVETAEPVTSIAPVGAPDAEEVQAQTRRVLEGESYDRSVIGSEDSMARQLIGAELLSALAGRNPERRERARAAFVEHGYFDEKTRDVREAAAPAERAAAARSLAIVGDRTAAPHLIEALEDDSMEVRRAAAEALGALREPTAVEPLEALLRRERFERNRIPNRIIQHAIETCRLAAVEEARAAEERAKAEAESAGAEAEASTAVEPFEPETIAHGVVEASPAVEETAQVEEVAPRETEVAPLEEAEQASAETTAPETQTALEAQLVVEEVQPAEEPQPVEESQLVEELQPVEEPSQVGEVSSPVESVSEPESESEWAATSVAESNAVEPFFAPPQAFESSAAEPQAAEESAAPGRPAKAGDWVEFDMSDIGAAGSARDAAPTTAESVFEFSSGEAMQAEGVAESGAQTAAVESLPFETAEETQASETVVESRGVEAPFESGQPETAVEARVAEGSAAEAVTAPLPGAQEKGVVPFNENSTVPPVIQQRLVSRDASVRAAAITELSHVDTDEAFQQICSAFDDEAKEVRSAAARALYELRTDRAESFTRALREAGPERRRNIGAAVSSSGLAGEAISQLTGESRDKTYESFSLLFLMAKAGEVQPLVRAIEGHPNNEVRLAVVKLLALSGQKEILPAFRRLAVRGSLPTEVRSAVMEAIYQISSSQPTHA